jgi:predicted RNA-binding protein with PIN domain
LPVRLERGAVDGTAEAVDQLLRVPGAVVLVDGYNLSMASSPTLPIAVQRDQAINLLTAAHARTGSEIHVVFDGGDVGERPSVQAPLGIRVHFSPSGVEADDVLIELVPSIDPDRAVVVVSSDGRVRDGVRRFGANVVRSEDLLAWARG